MEDKIIVGKKDIAIELEAIKKALIKKNVVTQTDINNEKNGK